MLRKLLDLFLTKPKNVFLFDCVGALVSAFFLGVVLVQFETHFGIPQRSLYLLAVFPIIFACYDLIAWRTKTNNISKYLNGIAIMNLLYCCLSIAVSIYHYQTITLLGSLYLIAEILIIITLAIMELRVSKKIISPRI